MKIVRSVYLIKGYKNPFPYINLTEIFKENEITFYQTSLEGRCFLRYNEEPISYLIGDCHGQYSCSQCFWGASNKNTTQEKKKVFDLLKQGKEIQYENI